MLLQSYLQDLRAVENGDLWLDETFGKKLEEVEAKDVFTQPLTKYHSIAQLLAHLTAWRISTLSIFNGNKKTVTSNDIDWPSNEELKLKGWPNLKDEFYRSQQELIKFLSIRDDGFLQSIDSATGKSFDYFLRGLVHHDMYHLGQLGLIFKMLTTDNQPNQ